MSAYRAAAVYVRDELAGVLRETEEGYSFAYDEAYLRAPNAAPVSLAPGMVYLPLALVRVSSPSLTV